MAITPCAGFVGAMAPIYIGFIAGGVCYLAARHQEGKFGYDDALDVVAVHLVGGLAGSLLLGPVRRRLVHRGRTRDGVFFGGGGDLLVDQLAVGGPRLVFSFVVTFVIAKVIVSPSACGSTTRTRTSASTSPSTPSGVYSAT